MQDEVQRPDIGGKKTPRPAENVWGRSPLPRRKFSDPHRSVNIMFSPTPFTRIWTIDIAHPLRGNTMAFKGLPTTYLQRRCTRNAVNKCISSQPTAATPVHSTNSVSMGDPDRFDAVLDFPCEERYGCAFTARSP